MSENLSITRIEARRLARDIPIGALVRAAGTHRSTSARLRRDPSSGRIETLMRLNVALDELIAARGAALPGGGQ